MSVCWDTSSAKPPSLADRLESEFKRNPGVWYDGLYLAAIGGAYAWRSRVSDLRKRGMTIENRQVRSGRFTTSFYRWVP